jgi:sensor histidine kinase YesM
MNKNENNNLFPSFLTHPKFGIFRHVLLLFIVGAVAFQLSSPEYLLGNKAYAAGQFLLFAGVVYLNIYALTPCFLFRGKVFQYIISVFISIIIVICLIIILQYITIVVETENYQPAQPLLLTLLNIFSVIISLGLIIAGTSAILLFKQGVMYEQRIIELENITVRSELEQLKNQINPHFLFNMLNNANELSKENANEAAHILFKLNDLLKYQLDDSAKDEILLSADIQFLTDLLKLEKIRRDNFDYIISTEGNINSTVVPPLLFTPFVENALKHGNDKKSYIHLYFNVENEGIKFVCVNSKPALTGKNKKNVGGLGLANIKRRLKLLYGQSYSLEITENENIYTVKLYVKK